MKTTYRHLIKILSCSLVIVAVLLSCIVVPANAAWITLHPADYIDEIYTEGNYRYVRYDFRTVPLIATPQGASGNRSLQVIPSVDNPATQLFYIYPMGIKFTGGPPLSANPSIRAIDVSDFKSNAALTVSSDLSLDFALNYTAYDEPLEETFYVDVVWSFASYGESGNYLGSVEQLHHIYTKDLQDVNVGEQFTYNVPISMTMFPLSFSEKVCYIVPQCSLNYVVTVDEEDICIDYFGLSCDNLTITTRTDMIYEQSLTMERIESQIDDIGGQLDDIGGKLDNVDGQLGDLNDTADEILSGSDQMNDAADDFSGTADNAQDDMNAILGDLEELPEADINDIDLTFDGLLSDGRFRKYSTFFQALSADTFWVSIMLVVCTFIWLSTLLYGRRA